MKLTVDATYEDGVLKLAQAAPLKKREKVRVTIQSETSVSDQTAGILRWTGEPEILHRVAEDDEFGIMESP